MLFNQGPNVVRQNVEQFAEIICHGLWLVGRRMLRSPLWLIRFSNRVIAGKRHESFKK
jgi:hypothetical protein